MSRPLQIDFAAPATSGVRVGGWLALVAMACALVAVADWRQQLHERLAAAELQIERLQHKTRRPAPPPLPAMDAGLLRRLQQANQVIDQLAVPWGALLDSVEAVPRRGVSLLQLLPNPKEQTLRLTGEATALVQVLDYADQLAQQPRLSDVHLVTHATLLREGVSVVGFSLQARWRLP